MVRKLRIIKAAASGDYDTVTRLVRRSLLSAAASKAFPLVGNGWCLG